MSICFSENTSDENETRNDIAISDEIPLSIMKTQEPVQQPETEGIF